MLPNVEDTYTLLGGFVKMHVLVQWFGAGARDSAFLTSFQVMLLLLDLGTAKAARHAREEDSGKRRPEEREPAEGTGRAPGEQNPGDTRNAGFTGLKPEKTFPQWGGFF